MNFDSEGQLRPGNDGYAISVKAHQPRGFINSIVVNAFEDAAFRPKPGSNNVAMRKFLLNDRVLEQLHSLLRDHRARIFATPGVGRSPAPLLLPVDGFESGRRPAARAAIRESAR